MTSKNLLDYYKKSNNKIKNKTKTKKKYNKKQ